MCLVWWYQEPVEAEQVEVVVQGVGQEQLEDEEVDADKEARPAAAAVEVAVEVVVERLDGPKGLPGSRLIAW